MSTTDVLTPAQLVAAVDQMDESQLDVLWDAAKARHKALRDQKAREAALSLAVGDHVRIENIRPKSIEGATGVIVSRSRGRRVAFEVKLDAAYKRTPGDLDDIAGIPAACLVKIEDGS